MPLEHRVRFLEKKVSGALNWVRQPHVWTTNTYRCKHENNTNKYHDVRTCYDYFDQKLAAKHKCVVYDMGIRSEPQFGEEFAKNFGCEVHAFDPSPVSRNWYARTELRNLKNYHFHPYGAGGHDGVVDLFDYNWDQVSIVDFGPFKWRNGTHRGEMQAAQRRFPLPVKTLGTIMKELGHTHIDMLKLDVEGSEYLFLEEMLDTMGCPPVDQMFLEWHHFQMDSRYGTPREINVLIHFLNDCGFKQSFFSPYWYGYTDVTPPKAGFTFSKKKLGYAYAVFVRPGYGVAGSTKRFAVPTD